MVGLKLIVQIPAYNEEKSIANVIREIPRKIKGIDKVEVLVIDDGSKDNTSKAAKDAGADHVIRNTKNHGLAYTFQKGLNFALKLGADIIVNTDADFQYDQKEIPQLLKPILDQKADIVSGNRKVETLTHMIGAKKYGNILGSKVVKISAGYDIIDASSGFRAYSREAALQLFVISKHTYTHETLIQAGHKNLKVIEVPVTFRKREGHSKLIKSVSSHIKKSLATIVRNTLMYNSLKFFSYTGFILIILGLIPFIRWFYLSYIVYTAGNHIQSLLVGVMLMVFGGMSILIGLISDILAINRKHLEEILYHIKKLDFEKR
ncbi:glycosyltransferase family 2 protein [Candidatus Pacearchaeota archaeon]|nr:glycosyltransferase family 2 protein [Candidatus Pacearchaeota archaeon]